MAGNGLEEATDNLISIGDAAAYLGLSVAGLRKIIDRSRRAARGESIRGSTITFFQASPHSTIKFRREWLDSFIAAGQVVCPRERVEQKKAARIKQAAVKSAFDIFAKYA